MSETLKTNLSSLNEHVLVYTFASARHYMFVAPCIFSTLRSNPGTAAEIVVASLEGYMAQHGREFHMLQALFGDAFQIRQSETYIEGKMLPHTVRFIESPKTRRRYTYITDIDIFLSQEGFARLHIDHMDRIGLPYSNMLRSGTTRLTGLHFTWTELMFPVPDLSDVDLSKRNDEEVLYETVVRKGLRLPPDQFRPVHGVHFSLNRPDPLPKDGQGIGWANQSQWQGFKRYAKGPEYDALWLVLSPEFKNMVMKLRQACEAEWPQGA
jgi:hypothetical protein